MTRDCSAARSRAAPTPPPPPPPSCVARLPEAAASTRHTPTYAAALDLTSWLLRAIYYYLSFCRTHDAHD